MSRRDDQRLAKQIKEANRRLTETEGAMGGLIEEEMIARWRVEQPKMVATLNRLGILREFAHVLEHRRGQAINDNRKAGMGWPDSREEANKDWMITGTQEADPLERLANM